MPLAFTLGNVCPWFYTIQEEHLLLACPECLWEFLVMLWTEKILTGDKNVSKTTIIKLSADQSEVCAVVAVCNTNIFL